VVDSACQCLLCGVSLPLRIREHAEIDNPVACLMLDSGTATRLGRISCSYLSLVHTALSPSACQASSSRFRNEREAAGLAVAVGEQVGSLPEARIAASDALAASTRSVAILLRVTGQQDAQSWR
jgi:hypothetical protein